MGSESPIRSLARIAGESGVIAVAVIEDGATAWTATAGGDEGTLFQTGSLSKTVSSALVLELVERGVLDLDQAVAGTTIRDLLGHTSGADTPFYPGYAQGDALPTLAESVAAVAFDPKTAGRFRYSGGGYTIVQQLIENATGKSFATAANELLFEPLGMTRSTFEQPPPQSLRAAAANPDFRLYPERAAAGLWTTAADLARFVCAVQSRPTPMTTPHVSLPRFSQWTLLGMFGLARPRQGGLGVFLRGDRFMNLGGATNAFSALLGSTTHGSGAVIMTTGCGNLGFLRVMLDISDAQGWSGVRASRRRGARRGTSDLLLRAFS